MHQSFQKPPDPLDLSITYWILGLSLNYAFFWAVWLRVYLKLLKRGLLLYEYILSVCCSASVTEKY